MKEYTKPEIEFVDFATEVIADQGSTSGEGWEPISLD